MSWETSKLWQTKMDAVDDVTMHLEKNGHKVLARATTKQGAYWAVSDQVKYKTVIHCAIFLYKGTPPTRATWIKVMTEDMGPIMNDCPEKILRLASPTTNEAALKFRQGCREKIDSVIEPRSLVGKTIKLFGNTYKVTKKDKQTHIATRLDNGRTYKLTRGQEAAAEVIE